MGGLGWGDTAIGEQLHSVPFSIFRMFGPIAVITKSYDLIVMIVIDHGALQRLAVRPTSTTKVQK